MSNNLNYSICKGCGRKRSKNPIKGKPAELTLYIVAEDKGKRPQPLFCDQECCDAANGIIRDTGGFVVNMVKSYKVKQKFAT